MKKNFILTGSSSGRNSIFVDPSLLAGRSKKEEWINAAAFKDGFNFKIIDDPIELKKVYRHRFEIFCRDLNVFEKKERLDNQEEDEYDFYSMHTALTLGDNIIAYTRLVFSEIGFPVEKNTVLPPIFNREKTVESSRTYVVKEWRSSNAVWVLLNNIYNICQEHGIDNVISFSNALMYNGLKKRNFPIIYVGEPSYFYEHKTYPLIIKIDRNIKPDFY